MERVPSLSKLIKSWPGGSINVNAFLVRFSWIFSWKNFTLERFYAALPQGTRFYALGEGHKGHYLEFQYCTPKSPLRLTATTRAALFAKNSIGIPGNVPCVPLRATCHGQVMSPLVPFTWNLSGTSLESVCA